MNKTTQDKLWAVLTDNQRKDVRSEYQDTPLTNFSLGYHAALECFFGKHNLTSSAEPEELLMVERKKIVEWYDRLCDVIEDSEDSESYLSGDYNGQKSALMYLFGSKCIPGEGLGHGLGQTSVQVGDKPSPKFQVGDVVVFHPFKTDSFYDAEIIEIREDKDKPYALRIKGAENIWAYPIEVQSIAETFPSRNADEDNFASKENEPAVSPTENNKSAIVGNDTESKITMEEKDYKAWNELSDESKDHIVSEWLHGENGYKDFKEEFFIDDPEYKQHEQYWIGWIEAMINTFPEDAMKEYVKAHKDDEDFKYYREIIDNLDNAENMEEKESGNLSQNIANCEKEELNLSEILKGCEGETVFSLVTGYGEIKEINNRMITAEGMGYYPDGAYYKNAPCPLFPSRDLWLKYPTDAAAAWHEWAESRKVNYLQAQIRLISNDGIEGYEEVEIETTSMHARQAADLIRETLRNFHERGREQ